MPLPNTRSFQPVTSPSTPLLRDADIRLPLEAWVIQQHQVVEETRVFHELAMPRPSARADLVVVNGELSAFEIKSDVDSLARLDAQINAYAHVFDRAAIVTTERHAQNTMRRIPEWWAAHVICAKDMIIRTIRNGKINKKTNSISTLYLLHRSELNALAISNGIDMDRSERRHDLIIRIAKFVNKGNLRAGVRDALKARVNPLPFRQTQD
jgi:hypothetical protein